MDGAVPDAEVGDAVAGSLGFSEAKRITAEPPR